MKKILFLTLASIIFITNSYAFFINWYDDIDSFVENAESIIIVECVSILTKEAYVDDMNSRFKVNVLSVLKGPREKGVIEISSFHRLEKGKKYLLSCNCKNEIFRAELSAVLLDNNYNLAVLEEQRNLKEKVLYIFEQRQKSINTELELLNFEKERLEKILKQN